MMEKPKQIAVFLWYSSTSEVLPRIADRFGLTSTLIINEVQNQQNQAFSMTERLIQSLESHIKDKDNHVLFLEDEIKRKDSIISALIETVSKKHTL